LPLPEFYNMPIRLIPTAVVAFYESTTQMDFVGGDGWVMSQDHRKAMRCMSHCLPDDGSTYYPECSREGDPVSNAEAGDAA
jgi:hypothetical protein